VLKIQLIILKLNIIYGALPSHPSFREERLMGGAREEIIVYIED
jgi:hypothetical protein